MDSNKIFDQKARTKREQRKGVSHNAILGCKSYASSNYATPRFKIDCWANI